VAIRSEKATTTIQNGELRIRDQRRAGGVETLVSTAAMERKFSGMTINSSPNECLVPEERKNSIHATLRNVTSSGFVFNGNQLHFEYQSRVRPNFSTGATFAVGEVRRNEELPLGAHGHEL
jgi:hypothetical protein